jgi:hypothetical protein
LNNPFNQYITMAFYYGGNQVLEDIKPAVELGRTDPYHVGPGYGLNGVTIPVGQDPINWNDCDEIMQDDNVQQWTTTGGPGFNQSPYSDNSPGSSITEGQINGSKSGVSVSQDDDTEANDQKRRAQNRAAQRAFRERKEQRVKELEQKLLDTENELKRLMSDNEVLKRENTILMTENQVMISQNRATKGHSQNTSSRPAPMTASFPSSEFYRALIGGHASGDVDNPSFAIYEKEEGETMMGPGAVWQRIVEDPQKVLEDSDIQFVLDYLLDKGHCDGFGPVFALKDVNEGIRIAQARKRGQS